MSSVKVEQRVNVKFLARLGKSATETYSLLMRVYGDECLSRIFHLTTPATLQQNAGTFTESSKQGGKREI
jgi:hypothetical protein